MSVVCSQLSVDSFKALVMRNLILETPVEYALHLMDQARKSTNYGAINISFNYEYNLAQFQADHIKLRSDLIIKEIK
jgi:hypothetical protein